MNAHLRQAVSAALAGASWCLAGNAGAVDSVTVGPGESISQIVDRLVPNNPEGYRRALQAVLALNAPRFPRGRADLVGEGFVLRLPATLRTARPTAAPHLPEPGGRSPVVYRPARGESLTALVTAWLPEQPFAQADAMIDLLRINPQLPRAVRARPDLALPLGVVLALPSWLVTVRSTALPATFDRKALLEGVFVPAMWNSQLAGTQTVSLTPPQPSSREVPVAAQHAPADESIIAQVTTMDRLESEQERLRKQIAAKPAAYQDRVLDASALPAITEEANPVDAAGYRGWLAETRVAHATGSTGHATDLGARAEYRQETLNHGEWVAQVDARHRSGDSGTAIGIYGSSTAAQSARITLRNLGFPISPQVFADTTVGDHASEITDALTRGYRAAFGSVGTLRGLSTHVFARDFDFRAGIGARGALTGGPFPGFERSGGSLAWLGYTQRLPESVYVGGQITHADVPTQAATNATTRASALALAFGFGGDLVESGSRRARLTLISSRTADAFGATATSTQNAHGRQSASGVYAEFGLRSGGFKHEAGAYWTQPNLYFADAAVANDRRGAYWRIDHRGTRLSWGAGFDLDDSNASHRAEAIAQQRVAASGNFQYRVDRNTLAGGNIAITHTRNTWNALNAATTTDNGGSRSATASAFYQTRVLIGDELWGRSRFTATARRNETIVANGTAANGQEVQWEHDWITGKFETMRPEFITTLGWARDTSGGQTQTYPTAGLQWKYWQDADFWFGGNLRYTSRSGNLSTSRGLSGTLNAERVFTGGWRAGLQASMNEARVDTTVGTLQPVVTRSNDRSIMLYVRLEGGSGTPYQSLGLRTPGSAGTGAVRGIVYFDNNRDGAQQPDERGVPGVEVELDGRYRVTTDRDGRFEFPIVATGNHRITLRLDTVPLPWGAALERGLEVNVPLRGTAAAAIPVVKVGE